MTVMHATQVPPGEPPKRPPHIPDPDQPIPMPPPDEDLPPEDEPDHTPVREPGQDIPPLDEPVPNPDEHNPPQRLAMSDIPPGKPPRPPKVPEGIPNQDVPTGIPPVHKKRKPLKEPERDVPPNKPNDEPERQPPFTAQCRAMGSCTSLDGGNHAAPHFAAALALIAFIRPRSVSPSRLSQVLTVPTGCPRSSAIA